LKRSLRYSDSDLLKGLVDRDKSVLRELYSVFFESIRQMVLYNNGREEDAHDLFHEALLVLFQKARTGDFILKSSLGTYLYSVSRLLWLKELEKRKRLLHQPVDFEAYYDPDDDIAVVAEYNEKLQIYRQEFEKLSADCQKVLSLFMDGMSISAITEQMGYRSDQHTRNRRYRCKLSLLNRIRAVYGDNDMKHGNDEDH
jgi:RNA polymerase sigma factor (sigma-70 family)